MYIAGHYLPEGVVVGTAPWAIHRNLEIWGDDAEEYRPERWLDNERKAELLKYFFPFGEGTRTCLGRHIAWMEIIKAIASILIHLDLELPKEHQEWHINCGGSVHQEDFFVTVRCKEP